ncbi:piggyBac transposable element-derived protein 4 [Trichonephila clavipes]|nr:piggyBac transposable element-derived protein 4 [Trichonephila clavipes]
MISVNWTKEDDTKEVPCPKTVTVYNDVIGRGVANDVSAISMIRDSQATGAPTCVTTVPLTRLPYLKKAPSQLVIGLVDGFDRRKERYQTGRRSLIDGYSSRKRKGRPASFQANKCVIPDDVRIGSVGNHMPETVSIHRRCRKCSRKGHEKRTRFMCAECDVPLCITTCFSSFHGK